MSILIVYSLINFIHRVSSMVNLLMIQEIIICFRYVNGSYDCNKISEQFISFVLNLQLIINHLFYRMLITLFNGVIIFKELTLIVF